MSLAIAAGIRLRAPTGRPAGLPLWPFSNLPSVVRGGSVIGFSCLTPGATPINYFTCIVNTETLYRPLAFGRAPRDEIASRIASRLEPQAVQQMPALVSLILA